MTELGGKSWDLSLYELHRTPQEAITDNKQITISPKDLQSELTCPICLEMLTSTMTTKECLHRFCAECITTALRSGQALSHYLLVKSQDNTFLIIHVQVTRSAPPAGRSWCQEDP